MPVLSNIESHSPRYHRPLNAITTITMCSIILTIALLSGAITQSFGANLPNPALTINGVPFATRAYWMRRANAALSELSGSPCPFAAFGTAIVNHTATNGPGELICLGVNENAKTGNPTLHGEMAAITNCTAILTDPHGRFKLTPLEAQAAFTDLSLYTNAESCPMCASAIRWAGFREYIYGTSIETLVQKGWGQIRIPSIEIVQASFDLPYSVRLMGEVLVNETDPYFLWQFDEGYPCPGGCYRAPGGSCQAI